MKIAFIGGGNMAEAIVAAIISKKIVEAKDVAVSDIEWSRRLHMEKKYGVRVTDNNREAIAGQDIVVLAVKPQSLNQVMTDISGQLAPNQLVLSIIAGKSIATISSGLKHDCIVRSMPNTPAQIGEGVTVWTATNKVSPQQKEWVASILGNMGVQFFMDDEKYLDMATAVSGSGPAYVFYFMESMVAAAVRIGLPAEMAEKMVQQTVLGAGHLVEKTGKTPLELRKMVTSPGGTTAEAIAHLEKVKFTELVAQAIDAAYQKAKKLGS